MVYPYLSDVDGHEGKAKGIDTSNGVNQLTVCNVTFTGLGWRFRVKG